MPREEAMRVAILIYGWNAAEAAHRVDAERDGDAKGTDDGQARVAPSR
jgi:hypothetical protein